MKNKERYGIIKVGESIFGKKSARLSRAELRNKYNGAALRERVVSSLSFNESKFAKSFFRILVVNDSVEEAAKILHIIKDECKFELVRVASSISEAWDILQNDKPFDIILSVYRTNDEKEDGFTLYKKIKGLRYIPTFFIVGSYQESEVDALQKEGVLILKGELTPCKIKTLVNGFYIKKLQLIMEKRIKALTKESP